MTDDSTPSSKDRLYRVLTLGASNRVRGVFYAIMITGIIVSLILCLLTFGKSLEIMLFWDRNDFFMDYFNSIFYSLNDPYFEQKIIYPALIAAVYNAIGIFLETVHGSFSTASEIRGSIAGMLSYILITAITLLGLYWTLSKSKIASQKETAIFYLLVLLSFPMLFTIDRGNSISIVIIFSLLFLIGYSSENKKIRYLSYVSLGIAAGIKIYPLLFGLLVLRKYIQTKKTEDLKDSIACILIGAIVFLTPFLLYEGSFMALINNASGFLGASDAPWLVDISNIIQATALLFGYSEYLAFENVGKVVSLIFLVFISLYVLFYQDAEKWELICILSGAMVLSTGIGVQYVLLYMVLPAWYFISSNPISNSKNVFFAISLALALMPFPVPYQFFSYLKGIMVWAIIIIILVSAAIEKYNNGCLKEKLMRKNLRV